ncbi:hypothetical protein L6452_05146 [Arctium lappa]|uniref:Uncharacterized protein n=1 Tax=Arctium lappa TaxID=4217 RepID=A0ACB9EF83_ARCLA|nr:hypothetical protein L6452_05146 [Arctium lappa]
MWVVTMVEAVDMEVNSAIGRFSPVNFYNRSSHTRKASWESDDDEEEDPNRKKQKMMIMEEENALISCKVCNVVCNSHMAFTSHLANHEHSAMAIKQVKVEVE